MENEEPIISVCRLCLSDNRSLCSILEYMNLVQKILICLNIEVRETDRISTMICKQCIFKVEEWYEFKNFCDDAQLKLHIRVNNSFQDRTEMPLIKEEINIEESEQIFLPHVANIKSEPLDIYDSELKNENPEDIYFTGFSAQNFPEVETRDSLLVPTEESYISIEDLSGGDVRRIDINDDTIEDPYDFLPGETSISKSSKQCKYCHKKFSNSGNRLRHERKFHNASDDHMSVQSVVADVPIVSELEFVSQHRKIYKMLRDMTCDCCNKIFDKSDMLINHLRKSMNIDPYTCFLCCVSFPDQAKLVHHEKKKFCVQRVKLLKDKNCLFKAYEHYTCRICRGLYGLRDHLFNHIMKKHMPDKFPACCSECNFEYFDSAEFQNHALNTFCMFNIYCSICKTNFGNESDFNLHSSIHDAPENAINCDDPIQLDDHHLENKFFNSLETYTNPFKISECHSLFACVICGKSYTSLPNMKRHVKIKHKSNNVQKVEFNEPNIMSEQQFVSDYKQIYRILQRKVCECCDKFFTTRKSLMYHLRKRFRMDPFTCFLCYVSFPNRSQYMKHKKKKVCLKREQLLRQPECSFKPYEHYKCLKCDTLHVEKGYMFNHIAKKHAPYEYPACCTECGMDLYSKMEFLRHNETDLCIFNVYCSICKILFQRPADFQSHTSVHGLPATIDHNVLDFSNDPGEDGEDTKMSTTIINPYGKILESNEFSCQICYRSYVSYKNLKRHLKINHRNHNYLACKYCFNIFLNKNQLCLHILHAHMRGKKKDCRPTDEKIEINFTCERCNVTYSNIREFDFHSLQHTFNNNLACPECKKVFDDEIALRNHNCKHSNLKMKLYRCSDSNSYRAITDFSSETSLFECTLCGESFSNDVEYKGHLLLHNPVPLQPNGIALRKFSCPMCNITFNSYSAMYKHRKTKHSLMAKRNFLTKGACRIVKKEFSSKQSQLRSKNYALAIDKKVSIDSGTTRPLEYKNYKSSFNLVRPAGAEKASYQCKICNRILAGPSGLVHHFHFHVYKSKCSICNKFLPDKSSLHNHLRLHKNPGERKKLSCTVCKKLFINAAGLSSHMKTHLSKKTDDDEMHVNSELWCKICRRLFLTKPGFISHSKIHNNNKIVENEQNFECNICKKVFLSSRGLKKHLSFCIAKNKKADPDDDTTVMSGQPISCTVCAKSFSHRGTLKNHFKSHFKSSQAEECKVCHRMFASLEEFTQHADTCNPGFQCNQCPKSFQTMFSLNVHKSWHLRPRTMKRNVLLKKQGRLQKMKNKKNHIKQETNNYKFKKINFKKEADEGVYKCTQCDISFMTAKLLRLHVIKHIF